MKKRIIQGIAMVTLTVFTLTARADDRAFEQYRISPLEEVSSIDAEAAKAWVLSYVEDSPIVITMHENKRCKTYIVRADHFEVAYECNKKGFGARHVNSSKSTVPYALTNTVINRDELVKQRIISPNQMDDNAALGLIATYLPDLINPNYKHLLN